MDGSRSPICLISRWRGAIPLLTLLILASLLFFSRLDCPLLEPEEARYAEIPRQMLAEGRWITPVLHGEDYYQKPALLYWLVMIAYQLFGVHDWTARLIPSLAGILLVLVTYAWAKRILGERPALVAGLILCLSPRFLYLDSMVTMDGLLCLWVVAGLACGHISIDCRLQSADCRFVSNSAICTLQSKITLIWWSVSALACGLGVLTKGPVAVVLIVGPLVLWLLSNRQRVRVPIRCWLAYAAVVGLVAAPWFIAVALRDPGASGTFFWLHNIVRYVAPFDHEKPIWYYLPGLALGLLPWSLLAAPFCYFALKRGSAWTRSCLEGTGFFALAGFACLLFFSLSGSKRPGYILPALPPLAVVLGTFTARAFSWTFRLSAVAATCAGVMAAVLMFVSRTWLAEYHRHYALREVVQPLTTLASDKTIVCYPRRWDSVSFYLGRDIAGFGPDDQQRLFEQLQEREAVLFMKNDKSGYELLHRLPEELEFVPRSPASLNVKVGVIKRKTSITATSLCSPGNVSNESR